MQYTRGISFVEIIIAAAVILILTGTVIGTYITTMTHYRNTTDTIQATYLLEEGVEAVKTMRDRSYTNEIKPLATGGQKHYLVFDPSVPEWQSTSTPQYVAGTFKRWFTLEKVTRNSDDRISASGSNDAGTRKLTVHLAWPTGNSTTTRSVTTYLSNIHDN